MCLCWECSAFPELSSLELLMESAQCQRYFSLFLARSYTLENMLFYGEVQSFNDKLLHMAYRIFGMFEDGGVILWRGCCGTLKRVIWYFEEGGVFISFVRVDKLLHMAYRIFGMFGWMWTNFCWYIGARNNCVLHIWLFPEVQLYFTL